MKKLIVFILIALLCGGCDRPAGRQPRPYPPTPSSGIYDPQKPLWIPRFDLLSGWEINPSDPASIRTVSDQGDTVQIYFDGYPAEIAGDTAEELRDNLADYRFCITESPTDPFINCSRGVLREDLVLGGQPVFLLRHWGSWKDANEEITEIFFTGQRGILKLAVDGDFSVALPAVEKMLSTLRFDYEKFTPQPGSEELGAL